MPKKVRIRAGKEIYEGDPEEDPPAYVTHVLQWTREEQIENAREDGTLDEMEPPLTAKEKAQL